MKKATAKTKTTPPIPAPIPEKKKAPVKTGAAKPKAAAPAVKKARPALTEITAQIDIGFGNTLWIRGDGPGLSWEKGLVMDCVADDKWSIEINGANAPIVFKFLVNDLSWSAGDDYVVQPGTTVALAPTF